MNNIHNSVAPSNARLWTALSRRFSWLTKYRFIYICTISVLHMRSVDYIPWSPLTSLLARLVLLLNLPQQQTRRDSPRKNKQMRPIGDDELSCHTLITITSQRVQPVAVTSHVPLPLRPLADTPSILQGNPQTENRCQFLVHASKQKKHWTQ